ncbi:MAG: LemA family protein [Gammaproteobacteria bacterium]|nr:LemA family protein [Gammaproteobacteria bacterium]MBU6510060.1 LemA family protein [Gammaproteobacteria bacterium]MDE2109256.1 LemA family protein [Gammaproteobacteria bacterium]MDE2461329.1 LemA family protein [Gammaproteobacteria bacterium]
MREIAMLNARLLQKTVLLVALVSAVSLLAGCGINQIPAQKQAVTAAWSQVLNEYQRRTDLVPNLVATVQAYATHEANVLEAVTNARAKVTQTQIPADILNNPQAFHQFEQNQATLSGALSRLMMVTENYPNLKANQNFLALQAQLEGTENRIAVARRDYILAVQQYDTTLTTIPGRWYHSMFYSTYQPVQNFTISEQAQQAPKVNFSGTP